MNRDRDRDRRTAAELDEYNNVHHELRRLASLDAGRPAHDNPYTANGYKDRADYLRCLCEEYPADIVHALTSVYGPSEDFDGLVTSLEDAMNSGDFDE